MKAKQVLTLTALGAVAFVSLTGCSRKKEAGGSNTIQVKMYEGGYGRDWFDQLARKFEDMKDKQGVTVKVSLEAKDYHNLIGESFKNEIGVVNENQYDLYLLDGPDVNQVIIDSSTILKTDKTALLEPLTPLLEKPGIGFNGKEDSKTLKERYYTGYYEASQYHNDVESNQDKWDGEIFALPWADAMTGLVCNMGVLNKYNIKAPLTTDQLIAACETINSNFAKDKIKPFIYSGYTAPGYWLYLYNTWFAQYSGAEAYKNFLKCIPESGDIEHDGWQVYQDPAIKEALKPVLDICKNDYMVSGCNGANYSTIHHQFALQQAAFMPDGDWIAKQIADNTPEDYSKLDNTVMLRLPILSSIGTEIGCTDDEQLATIVDMIDNKKSTSEIIAAVPNVTAEGVKRVKEARGVYHGEGANHVLLVPSYCDAKDVTLEFIRFMYSEDACNLYSEVTKASLPFSYTPKAGRTYSGFEKSVIDLHDIDTVNMVAEEAQLNEIRKTAGIRAFNNTDWPSPSTFKTRIQDNKMEWTPEYMAEKELAYVQKYWSGWMGSFSW